MFPVCGLLVITDLPFEKQRVDLESSDVKINVNGFIANISVELSYKNHSERHVEVAYILPLNVRTAVHSFEAELNGRKIKGHCMEKKKAKEIYDKAVKEGHTAIFGSEDRFSGDLIHLRLGNLPKDEYANLQLKMVQELPLKIDGAVDFTLPTVFNPRYAPADHESGPEHFFPAFNNCVTPNRSPYSLHVKAEVQGSFTIANIKSLTDQINVNINDDGISATIAQDGELTFDHDWSFQIYYQSVHNPHCLQMTGDRTSTGLMKDDVIMLNLFPEVPIEDYSPHNEIILVVDRSGSMQGSKIMKAKNTLLLFLKSLPPGCRFNVVSFGSNFETLFKSSSEPYTEITLKKALNLQKKMDANMGGTEILQALRHVYSKDLVPGYPRQIIVLTDGQVWNEDQIFELIQLHADDTRVFSVGIGVGASTSLVEGMAMVGKGRCEMITDEGQFQTRVMGLIGSMLQKNVQDLTVECKVDPPQDLKLVPKIPPLVFGGQHLILYARLKPNSKIDSIKVGWKIGSDQFSCELTENDCKSLHDSNFSFHRLAAKAQLIQWIKENKDTGMSLAERKTSASMETFKKIFTSRVTSTKPKLQTETSRDNLTEDIINLSIASNVICKLTSFVGFDQDNKVINEQAKEYISPLSEENHRATSYIPKSKTRHAKSYSLRSKSSPRHLREASITALEDLGGDDKNFLVERSYDKDSLVEGRDDKDSLVNLISYQQFDGSWLLSDCLKVINLNKTILDSVRSKMSLNDVCFGTALVLAYFELKFDSRKEEWKLVSIKGYKFLKANNIDSPDVVQKCLNEIKDQI